MPGTWVNQNKIPLAFLNWHQKIRCIFVAPMRFYKVFFYIITVLTIGEVTTILSQYRQDLAFSFSSDWMEAPLEEDGSKEYEDDDDFFYFLQASSVCLIKSAQQLTSSPDSDVKEPSYFIIVPPPQG